MRPWEHTLFSPQYACLDLHRTTKNDSPNLWKIGIIKSVYWLESHFLHSISCSDQQIQSGERLIKSRTRSRFCIIQCPLPIEVKVFPESISREREGGRVYATILNRLVFRVALVAIRTVERPERIRISVIVCSLQL